MLNTKKLKLKIDQFYRDKHYGTIKFLGYKEGKLVFAQYEKSYEDVGWGETGQRINLDPDFFQMRYQKLNRTRAILPPA